MTHGRAPVSFFAFTLLTASYAGAQIGKVDGKVDGKAHDRWARVTTPVPGPPAAIGGYAAGCLRGGVRIARTGVGYEVLRIERRRDFGHPMLIDFVQRLGTAVKKNHLGLVLIGDLAQARGGPTLTGHRSHQSGLDVDIGYLTDKERKSTSFRSVVDLKASRLTSAWNSRIPRLLALAASDPDVDRIFVHPAVKRALCASHPRAAWLARVRPWWAHHDHFHVRLKCPASSAACEGHDPLPPDDDGCGPTLDWWWSEDARATLKRRTTLAAEPPPGPPEACAALLAP